MMPRMSACCLSGDRKVAEHNSRKGPENPWETYSLKELLQATNNFSERNKVGEGGYGTVYLGQRNKGTQIAVKRLKGMSAKAEMEFAVEVEMLGRVRHKNLLGLRGFYAGGQERLIVYDYMPNQNIGLHLHGRPDSLLDWPQRVKIAIGAVEGLAYLHHEAKPHIIHRDIKASNVLLDADFSPRVADFGFAKLIPEDVSHMTTRVKGTVGYLAPEYAMWGKVSRSCDVYSFGILLLELVSGRRPVERLPNGKKRDIVQWVRPLVEKGKVERVVDSRLEGRYDGTQLRTLLEAAIHCISANKEKRPTMKQILEVFKSGVEERKLKEVLWRKEEEEEDDDESETEGFVISVPLRAPAETPAKGFRR